MPLDVGQIMGPLGELSMTSHLFSPVSMRELKLTNRLVVSPMCQYSADDGSANDWHMMHLGTLANSGAGLLIVEATAVEREGRITHGCLGLYSDANEAALKPVVQACRRRGFAKLGIQLGHAGRKASAKRPWEGAQMNEPEVEAPWPTKAASAIPFGEGWHVPQAYTAAEIEALPANFAVAVKRADRLGFDLAEGHGAHGYLLHQFLSPHSNKRTDQWGGSLENRMRLPLDVFRAMRAAWPASKPLGMRISAVDWVDGAWSIEDSIVFSARLKDLGCDFIDVSTGGIDITIRPPVAPGFQVPFATAIKQKVGIPVMAVGMIADAEQAEAIIAEGCADMVALARGFLDDPHWGWHAAYKLGAEVKLPPQYARAGLKAWDPARQRHAVKV
jgi:2,4-dienoyl-CoA reductase-like NADH-dependent reductase (Old Yellow Enzyme family)